MIHKMFWNYDSKTRLIKDEVGHLIIDCIHGEVSHKNAQYIVKLHNSYFRIKNFFKNISSILNA